MNVFEVYKKFKNNGEWATPANLRHTRRVKYGMTQMQFANLLDIAYKTYVNWEQGRCKPSTPSKALLHIVSNDKELFFKR